MPAPERDPTAPITSAKALVDYAGTLDCIHCGLCLQSCPTYRLSGVETSSPRGRVHLMRAVAEGRIEPDAAYAEELDFCLLCRGCESACPAGVRFGEMMAHARAELPSGARGKVGGGALGRAARWIGLRGLLPRRWALRALGSGLRLAQLTGVARLVARAGGERLRALADLPGVPSLPERRLLPRVVRERGELAGEVAFLEGCVMPELYARVNRATVDSLSLLGYRVHVLGRVACCGSLHAHNGDTAGARALAERLLETAGELRGSDGEALPIVLNSAGCGSHLKELEHVFPDRDGRREPAAELASRVRDYTEVVDARLERSDLVLRLAPGAIPEPVVWDDPCHLCHGQGIRAEPRRVLDRIEGLARVELPDSESCCGSAGIYSLTRPADSMAVFAGKLEALSRTGARAVVTANPGCQLQWETGLRRAGLPVRVLHLAEVVAATLRPPDSAV